MSNPYFFRSSVHTVSAVHTVSTVSIVSTVYTVLLAHLWVDFRAFLTITHNKLLVTRSPFELTLRGQLENDKYQVCVHISRWLMLLLNVDQIDNHFCQIGYY